MPNFIIYYRNYLSSSTEFGGGEDLKEKVFRKENSTEADPLRLLTRFPRGAET